MFEHLIDAELDRMWNLCPECVKTAKEQKKEAGIDDLYVAIARVGFSYHQHLEKWTTAHNDSVKDYMTECDSMGHDSRMKHYLALCHGALMGMYSAKHINKELLLYGMSRLPGIVFGRGNQRP